MVGTGLRGGERANRRDEAAILQQRRSHAPRQVAELLQRVLRQRAARPSRSGRTARRRLSARAANSTGRTAPAAGSAAGRRGCRVRAGAERRLRRGGPTPETPRCRQFRAAAPPSCSRRAAPGRPLVDAHQTVNDKRQNDKQDPAHRRHSRRSRRRRAPPGCSPAVARDQPGAPHMHPRLTGLGRQIATPEPVRHAADREGEPDDRDDPRHAPEHERDEQAVHPRSPRCGHPRRCRRSAATASRRSAVAPASRASRWEAGLPAAGGAARTIRVAARAGASRPESETRPRRSPSRPRPRTRSAAPRSSRCRSGQRHQQLAESTRQVAPPAEVSPEGARGALGVGHAAILAGAGALTAAVLVRLPLPGRSVVASAAAVPTSARAAVTGFRCGWARERSGLVARRALVAPAGLDAPRSPVRRDARRRRPRSRYPAPPRPRPPRREGAARAATHRRGSRCRSSTRPRGRPRSRSAP